MASDAKNECSPVKKSLLKQRPPTDEQTESQLIKDDRWTMKVQASNSNVSVEFETHAKNGESCPRVKPILDGEGEYQIDIKQSSQDHIKEGWWFIIRAPRDRKFDAPFHFRGRNEDEEVSGIPFQGNLSLSLSFNGKTIAEIGPAPYKKTSAGRGRGIHKRNIRVQNQIGSETSQVGSRKRITNVVKYEGPTGLLRLLEHEEEHGKFLPVVAARMFVPWEFLPSEWIEEEQIQQLRQERENRIVPRHICFDREREIETGKKLKKNHVSDALEQVFEFDKRKPPAFRLSIMGIRDSSVEMNYSGYTIKELKDQLSEMNVPVTGTKLQLLERFKSLTEQTKSTNIVLEETAKETIAKQSTGEEMEKVTVVVLRKTLKELGMPWKGTKIQLIQRIQEHKNSVSPSSA